MARPSARLRRRREGNYAIYSGTNWIIMNAAANSETSTPWGQSGDLPVQNDYDGDGIVDIAVWHAQAAALSGLSTISHRHARTEYWGLQRRHPRPGFLQEVAS